jgi:hypothetical protein
MASRWHWGHGIALVYGTFALATVGFVVFAMDQPVDLVSEDYYARSITLDARRAAEANARALGAGFTITTRETAVEVQWPAAAREGATGTLTLYRPSDARADRTAAMAPDADGRQPMSLSGLAPGKWMLQVEWQASGRTYYAEREVDVR